MKAKKEKKVVETTPYYEKMHRIGFWMTVGALIIFFGIPVVVCLVYDIMPSIGDVLVASGALILVFVPIGVAEMFPEVPVMGSSYYIATITGNIMNLKLPAAINALKVADVKQGTEKADAIVGVAVAVSSLVTIIFLAIGVLLLVPLKPLLQSPVVTTAASYCLPALFGCMILGMLSRDVGGGVRITGRLKAAILPFIFFLALYLVLGSTYESIQGILMLICIPILWVITKRMYKKGKIIVELPEEQEELCQEE